MESARNHTQYNRATKTRVDKRNATDLGWRERYRLLCALAARCCLLCPAICRARNDGSEVPVVWAVALRATGELRAGGAMQNDKNFIRPCIPIFTLQFTWQSGGVI